MKKKQKLPRGITERSGTLYITFTRNGKTIRECTKQSSTEVAVKLLAKRRSENAISQYYPEAEFHQVKFGYLIDKYWQEHGKDTRSKLQYLLPELRTAFGDNRAAEIRPGDVKGYLRKFKDAGYSGYTINHHRSLINAIFNHAIRYEYFDRNPCRAVQKEKEPPKRKRVLSVEEFQRFMSKCDELGHVEVKAFVILALLTTMRKSEILERPWADVFLDHEPPYIYVPRTKNDEPKEIPLAEVAVNVLRKLQSFGSHAYLFPAKPNPKHRGNFKKPHAWDLGKPFREVCKEAKIDGLRIHDLRHTGITALTERDVSDAKIRAISGHFSDELRRYQHPSLRTGQQTVQIIQNEFFRDPETVN